MTGSGRLHPLTLLFEAVRVGRAFLLPAVIGGASVGGGDFGQVFRWAVALMAVPALLAATAKYISFRFRLDGTELVLESGVLSRNRRVIPLARIQHIDVRQSALQRATGVAELRVETAGGDSTEAVLNVLRHADAEALRSELLARRGLGGEAPASEVAQLLARLTTGDLALAGATANEVGLVAALLGGAFNLGLQLGIDLPRVPVEPDALLPDNPAAAVALLVSSLIVVFLVLGWVLSVVGAVLRYHGFTLERSGDEIRKRYGLLARHEAFIPLRRIQTVRVEESLLRRKLGLAALKVETAGGSPGERRRGGAEAFVPLARRREVARLVRSIFPDFDYAALHFRPVHPRSRLRAFLRYAAPLVVVTAVLAIVRGNAWLGLAALLPLAFVAAHLGYRQRGYALAPGFMIARGGFLNRITWIVPEAKIQTVHIGQTPLQLRHGLADLILDTAGGQAVVADLHRDDAHALLARAATALAAAGRPGHAAA